MSIINSRSPLQKAGSFNRAKVEETGPAQGFGVDAKARVVIGVNRLSGLSATDKGKDTRKVFLIPGEVLSQHQGADGLKFFRPHPLLSCRQESGSKRRIIDHRGMAGSCVGHLSLAAEGSSGCQSSSSNSFFQLSGYLGTVTAAGALKVCLT